MYIQLIIAGLKTILHLTPFLLTWYDIGNYKKEQKFYLLNMGVCQIANQNFTIIWLAVWFPPISIF